MRKEAVRTRQTPRYDNRCRHLTSNQVNEKLGNNEKHVIRFKLRSGPVDFHDLIMSNVRIDLSETESDFIILKSDGFPTYHLANVIDDHHMQISHVLRGIEWLHSTPKHLMLYDAFGWRAPLFAHLPLILNQGGGKLSKRHEHVNLAALKANGVRPESVLNYLASIGGGFDLELSRNNSKIYSIRELIDAFDVKLIRNIPNKLDSEKLLFFNRLAIQKAVDAESPDLLHELKSLIQDKLNVTPNDDQIRRTAIALRDRVSTVNDMVDEYAFFWTDQISTRLSANIDVELCVLVLDDAAQVFESHDSDHIQPQQFELMKHFCSVNKIKYGKYMQVLRLTLTGKKDGLPISELYELLGKSTVLRKIRYFRSNVLHNSTESNERVNL